MTEEIKIVQEPKIVQQILAKVLAGDRTGLVINIFIIQNNDGVGREKEDKKDERKEIPYVPKLEGRWSGLRYHITKEALEKALEASGWNQAGAGRILGIPRDVIRRRCEHWNIKPPEE